MTALDAGAPGQDGEDAAAGPIGGAQLPAVPDGADVGRQIADALAADDDGPEVRETLMSSTAAPAIEGGGGQTAPGGSQAERFFRHVLPEPGKGHGHCCLSFLHHAVGKGKQPFSHDVLGIIEGAAARALAKGADPTLDVYVALFTLNERQMLDGAGRVRIRVQDNAAFCRCLFLDLDCGKDKHGKEKDYADQRTAFSALKTFSKAVGLPQPTIVSSGNGLHVYWTFDRALSRDAWLDLATNFRRLIDARGFQADRSKVTDVTTVLRVPGTFNRKDRTNPLPVRVLVWGEHTPVERIMAIIDGALAAAPAANGLPSRGPEAALQAVGGASGTDTLSPFEFGPQAVRDATPPPSETSDNVASVRDMLAVLDPDCGRDEWRRIVWAVLATGWSRKEELAREWSARSAAKWDEDDFAGVVRSFDPARGIGYGTLVYHAQQAGYTGPTPGLTGARADGAVLGNGDGTAIGSAAAGGVAAAAIDEGGDVALGRLFAARHRGKLVYVPENEGWLGFDPLNGWWPDPFAAERAAKEVSDAMFADAVAKRRAGGLSDSERKKLFGFAERAARLPQQRAMIVEAMSEPGMSASAASFDADPMLLGHPGGVLDLNTGSPVVITPDTRVTKRCGVSFDPDATCPMWDRFIASIFPDAEKRAFVQRLAGYFLTGWTREQQFVFAQGGGQNGKSTFFEVLAFVLGDYAVKLATEMLMQSKLPRNPQGPSADVMALKGARLAFTGETEEGQRLATSRIKEWTGDGELSGRVPYAKRVVTFAITHKLVFVGNAKVAFPDTGHAMARRFIFLTFDVTIPPARKDAGLKGKLEREGPGILNWMLAGLRDYLAGCGLRVPAAMQDAARDYLKAEDTLGTFLADSFEAGSSFTISKEALRHRHEEWCKENGHQPLGQTALTRKLNERGISYDRNTRTFKGIRVPPPVLPAGRA